MVRRCTDAGRVLYGNIISTRLISGIIKDMLLWTNNQVVCLRYGKGGDYGCLINSGVLLRREAHHRHDYSHLLILSFYRTLDSDS
jgi:hypothetical protein